MALLALWSYFKLICLFMGASVIVIDKIFQMKKAFFFPCELSEGSYDELACMLTDTNHPVENCIVYIVLTNARYFPI